MIVTRKEKNEAVGLDALPIGPFVAGDEGDFLYVKLAFNSYLAVLGGRHVEKRDRSEMVRRVTPDVVKYRPVKLVRVETEYV